MLILKGHNNGVDLKNTGDHLAFERENRRPGRIFQDVSSGTSSISFDN